MLQNEQTHRKRDSRVFQLKPSHKKGRVGSRGVHRAAGTSPGLASQAGSSSPGSVPSSAFRTDNSQGTAHRGSMLFCCKSKA